MAQYPRILTLMMNKMNSGIYKITCLSNGQFYIGKSKSLTKRRKSHFRELKYNRHENNRLQRCFNKYGEDSLVFEVIIECNPDLLNILEQYLLDEWVGFQICLNISQSSQCPSNLGKSMSDITKHKLRLAHKKFDDAEEKKIAFEYLMGESGRSLAAKYGCCLTSIQHVLKFQEVKPRTLSEAQSKAFKLIHPLEGIVEGKNLKEFCKERGIKYPKLLEVTARTRKSHLGWRNA